MATYLKQTYNFLGHDDVFYKIALVAGLVQVLRCSDFLESPLGALCCAIIFMAIYSCLANVVLSFTPLFLVPVFSIILLMSITYYVFFKKSCVDVKPVIKTERKVDDKGNEVVNTYMTFTQTGGR
jgi:hypothetical protein